jgi:NAD(P)-dependent dehydrogenase (short-subunit alcohol dehydrogenase family)
MSNQTVVITGANRGLGLELARVFSARGDTVLAGCRAPSAATELATLTPYVFALDLGDETSIAAFVATCSRAIGERPVDVVINNAGIDARAFGVADGDRDVLTLSGEHFIGEFRVNTVGPMLLARGLVSHLRLSTHGRIVNLSSQIASMEVSATMGRDVGYAVSKAALNMVTVKLASRLRDDGIVAIALHPGYLRTEMGAANAPMGPEEAARSIVELIDRLTLDDSGRFLRWDGSIHPW